MINVHTIPGECYPPGQHEQQVMGEDLGPSPCNIQETLGVACYSRGYWGHRQKVTLHNILFHIGGEDR